MNHHQANELLDCPMCGKAALIQEHQAHSHAGGIAGFMPDYPGSFTIECTGCNLGLIEDKREQAIAAWNRRAPASEPAVDRGSVGKDHKFRTLLHDFWKRSSWNGIKPNKEEQAVIDYVDALAAPAAPAVQDGSKQAKDAARWRYARLNSYIEVRCNSPRVDSWTAEFIDHAIDLAMRSSAPAVPAAPLVASDWEFTEAKMAGIQALLEMAKPEIVALAQKYGVDLAPQGAQANCSNNSSGSNNSSNSSVQSSGDSGELLAAADAVVERWHSRDWKQPHTADFIARLAAAVGDARRTPATGIEPTVQRVAELQSQLRCMRQVFHVNMMAANPGKSHERITAAIDGALECAGWPNSPEFDGIGVQVAQASPCTLTDAELADPEYVRAYIEGCNESFAEAMDEIKRLRAATGNNTSQETNDGR